MAEDLEQQVGSPDLAVAFLDQLRNEAMEHFWKVPYQVDDGSVNLDGATWIVEGRKEGQCHVVTRWSPEPNDPFRRFAWAILGLTRRSFVFEDVY